MLKSSINRVRVELARRKSGRAKRASLYQPTGYYNCEPQIAVVVQTHNKQHNLNVLLDRVRQANPHELIIIDDGSSDDTLTLLRDKLTAKNEFIIRSNDLFEIRMYNRAIAMSRAEYIVLLQDDDIPDLNCTNWLADAVACMEADPRLAVLGGRDALELQWNGDAINYRRTGGRSFSYTEYVNRAPFLVRKQAWIELGGFDEQFAPYQCDDVDYCIRSWLSGWHVGHQPVSFIRDVGVGGMRLLDDTLRAQQMTKNWALVNDRYVEVVQSGHLRALVEKASTCATVARTRLPE